MSTCDYCGKGLLGYYVERYFPKVGAHGIVAGHRRGYHHECLEKLDQEAEGVDLVPPDPPNPTLMAMMHDMQNWGSAIASIPCKTALMHGRSDERWDREDD